MLCYYSTNYKTCVDKVIFRGRDMAETFFNEEIINAEETQSSPTSIIKLFGREKLEDIQQKIAKATGLAFVTVDYKGEPVTETTCFTDFCRAVREGGSCETCKRSDAFGALQAVISRKPSVYFCPCGLLEVAIPIEDNGVFLGGFIGGQIRCEDAPATVTRLEQVFRENEALMDNEYMQGLKENVKTYSYQQFTDVVNLIHLVINQMCQSESDHVKNTSVYKSKLIETNEENQKLRYDLEISEQKRANLMMNQNPYFLANTLSTVANTAYLENATETSVLLLELADFLKQGNTGQDNYLTLAEEMEQIERYIKLSCAKYDKMFSYQIRVMDKMKNRKIPAHSILPFVQNAVFFGIALSQKERNLIIDGKLESDKAIITITEDGPGLSEEEIQEKFSIYQGNYEGKYIERAMHHAKKRLKSSYGEEYELKIFVEPGVGRTFQIVIPAAFKEGGFVDV